MDVSVVIPVLNAGRYIRECLDQIKRQDYPLENIEVLVADGGSEDDTVDSARRVNCSPMRVRVIEVGNPGRAQGLNAAIKVASGSAICRLDARTRIRPDYVRKCVETLSRTGAMNVGGLLVPVGDTSKERAIAIAMAHPFGVGGAQFRVGTRSGEVDTVYLGFFSRRVFEEVGLFDEDGAVISEDSDLNFRIRKAGGVVFLNTDIEAYYRVRSTLRDQFCLYYRYGGARAGNILKHLRITSLRQIVAPSFTATLACSGAAAFVSKPALLVFSGVVGVYLAASLVCSCFVCIRSRMPSLIPAVVGSFASMHFGFGFGFWRRLAAGRAGGAAWKG
jgi:succinoglycan biosynthesis protein ExoA